MYFGIFELASPSTECELSETKARLAQLYILQVAKYFSVPKYNSRLSAISCYSEQNRGISKIIIRQRIVREAAGDLESGGLKTGACRSVIFLSGQICAVE